MKQRNCSCSIQSQYLCVLFAFGVVMFCIEADQLFILFYFAFSVVVWSYFVVVGGGVVGGVGFSVSVGVGVGHYWCSTLLLFDYCRLVAVRVACFYQHQRQHYCNTAQPS